MENKYELHERLDTLPPQFYELLEHPLAIYKFYVKHTGVIYLSNVGKIEDSDIKKKSLGYIEFFLHEDILDRNIPDHDKDSTLIFMKVNKDIIQQQIEIKQITKKQIT